MLFPFHGYLLGGPDPVSRGAAAARSRRIRDDGRRYQGMGVLDEAVAAGRLRSVPGRHLFRYRIETARGRVVTGLVGEVPVSDLLPHEGTRTTLVEPAPPIEIRPILLVTRDETSPGSASGKPAAVTDGVWRHEARPLRGSDGAFVASSLVIADGHHRTRAVRETMGADARILAMVVGASGAGLDVGTFHRVLPGVAALPGDIDDRFTVEATGRKSPSRDALLWIEGDSGRRFLLRPREDALATLPAPLRGSPAAVASRLLYPMLGRDEKDVRYAATAAAALKDQGPGDVALLMSPPSMQAVLDAAESHTPLPPKSTRFSPKPVRGLVLRAAG